MHTHTYTHTHTHTRANTHTRTSARQPRLLEGVIRLAGSATRADGAAQLAAPNLSINLPPRSVYKELDLN